MQKPSVHELIAAMRKKDQACERLQLARHDEALVIAGVRLSAAAGGAESEVRAAAAVYDAACEELAQMILECGEG